MTSKLALTASLLSLSLMACGGTAALPQVSFDTERAAAARAVAIEENVTMRFTGFEPGARVTVRVQMEDGAASFATFEADETGGFDTARIPLSGSYSGADVGGLFWSMEGRLPRMVTSGALHLVVSAEVDGNELLRERLERYASPELLPVAEPELCSGVECPQPAPLF